MRSLAAPCADGPDARPALRLITYLAPSLPVALFEAVARHLGAALGMAASLRVDARASAPPPGEPDPFSRGEADVGFLCAPGYLELLAHTPPAVALLGAAPVF